MKGADMLIDKKDRVDEIRELARIRQQKHRMSGKDIYSRNEHIHKWLTENAKKIVNMYEEKISIKKIAEEMGVGFTAIYSLLIKNNALGNKKKKEETGQRKIYPSKRKEENLKPFYERISPELQMMLKRNQEINNIHMKRYDYDTHEKEENVMVGNVVEMKETMLQPKK
jgi:transposase